MHDRAAEYGACARLVRENPTREGVGALFDAAVTNGLAAIVARRWSGSEYKYRRFMKPANDLLAVIEQYGRAIATGVVELPDLDPPPPGVEVFGGSPDPTPTIVEFHVLREAIRIATVPRHARPQTARRLEARHVAALVALETDSSLRGALSEGWDLTEERVAIADAEERQRARAYLNLLSDEELERRSEVDYVGEYTEVDHDVRVEPLECPVCDLQALVPRGVAADLGLQASGTCAACSYTRSREVAEYAGRDADLRRVLDDPNT